MNKILVFDMDGTIADLYNVENWLDEIRAENPAPYADAEPLYDMTVLNAVLDVFRMIGWKIVVTSWLAKGSTAEYDEKVKRAKTEWLNKGGFPYDEIHIVPYGTPKTACTKNYGGYQVLVDDNADVRAEWNLGDTVDANKNVLDALLTLLRQQ